MTTLEFARYECNRYLAKMGLTAEITLTVAPEKFDPARFFHFDAALDDAFSVKVTEGKGEIIATNPRSVLFGVYHFLKVQGCRFHRPGPEGEFVPLAEAVADCDSTIYAKTRHRGTTDWGINGGVDAILTYLDWLPKQMMNSFMIEYTDYYQALCSGYRRKGHPFRPADAVTREQYARWDARITRELKQRGLLRHGAGHGFTNTVMHGIREVYNFLHLQELGVTEHCENPEVLALVNGERTLHKGVPLNTNLCLSKEAVRAEFIRHVCDYSEAHPEIDYLHVWLGDSFGWYCQCEGCQAMSPTDWYLLLLNELDEELTRRGSAQKIVFLVYFELLYPPVTQRIANEDRFVLLFCPYGRDFTRTYASYRPKPYHPGEHPFDWDDMDGELYLSQLRDWQKIFHGDSLAFDYNLYDFSYPTDMTHQYIPPVVAEDSAHPEILGLNGRIECGNYRMATPTPLLLLSMAQGLFYGEELDGAEYFREAYGEKEPVRAFLSQMKDVLPREYLLRRQILLTEEDILRLHAGRERLQNFRKTLFAYDPEEIFQRRNCDRLAKYLVVWEVFLEGMEALVTGNRSLTEAMNEDLCRRCYWLEEAMPLYFSAKDTFLTWNRLWERAAEQGAGQSTQPSKER